MKCEALQSEAAVLYIYIYKYIYLCIYEAQGDAVGGCMGWLRSVISIKLYVSFAEYRLF